MTVKPSDRKQLEAILQVRKAPQKHPWRAKIILLSTGGLGTNEIMRQTGKSKTCVWRWQERFMAEGFEGLLCDKTRPSRIAPLGLEVAERCATRKHPQVIAWLARHKHFTFHFTPTSCSWLNAVERYFAKLSKQRLKRGVFRSVVEQRQPSSASMRRQTKCQGLSSGPSIPIKSSPPSNTGTNC
jgi:transposase